MNKWGIDFFLKTSEEILQMYRDNESKLRQLETLINESIDDSSRMNRLISNYNNLVDKGVFLSERYDSRVQYENLKNH